MQDTAGLSIDSPHENPLQNTHPHVHAVPRSHPFSSFTLSSLSVPFLHVVPALNPKRASHAEVQCTRDKSEWSPSGNLGNKVRCEQK
ncbi:hypothetical protein PoB_007700000 [Plakobranchus ocellatus]|uniref:Uncharacterized protein n=1 Tax=Plakobranchus ocellatus TaxID=259542 RepID=A0AAV4E2M2_9GAST|nr:hypothetical protein PoB_007700000 [Plakobranchus ocellatus]